MFEIETETEDNEYLVLQIRYKLLSNPVSFFRRHYSPFIAVQMSEKVSTIQTYPQVQESGPRTTPMTELPTEVVGEAYTDPISWTILTDLVDVSPRMAGHDGEQTARKLLADAFREQGLRDVGVEQFEVPAWYRGSSSLSLPERERSYTAPHELFALPRTPAGNVEAELVDVGHGTPAEFEEVDVSGKIVIVKSGTPDSYDRWFHRRDKYANAIEDDAVGFLFSSHADGCLPPTGDLGTEDGPGAIPAAGVSHELGSRLVRYCEAGTVRGELRIDCHTEQRTSGNLSGRLGPQSDEEILVTAHHDAHDIAEGAKDNGCGSALLVEVARLLSKVEGQLETTVRFVSMGAEEIGMVGSKEMAANSRLDSIKAVLNIDGVGDSRDLAIYTHGFPVLGNVFETVGDTLDIPIDIRENVNTHSDHWPFVREGVPGMVANSVSGSSERGWGHTHADTLDKLDRRDLRDLAVPLATGLLILAEEDRSPDHVDPRTIIERAQEEGYDV